MSNSSKNTKTQRERFIEAAREVGVDEDPEAFRERLKKLVKAPAPPKTKKQKTKKEVSE